MVFGFPPLPFIIILGHRSQAEVLYFWDGHSIFEGFWMFTRYYIFGLSHLEFSVKLPPNSFWRDCFWNLMLLCLQESKACFLLDKKNMRCPCGVLRGASLVFASRRRAASNCQKNLYWYIPTVPRPRSFWLRQFQ